MTIRLKKTFRQRPDVVWQALTDARAIRQWWVETDFVPQVGREFTMRDVPQGSWDGITRGRVLACDPPRMIRFTWVGGGNDLEVTYRLSPGKTGGTEFELEHSGFRGASGLFLSVLLRFGWRRYLHVVLPELAGHLEQHGFAQPFAMPSKAQRVGAKAA